jgi:predicted regulator of Ras-like GTPase activity (Roadblock/LC7/MglB family)
MPFRKILEEFSRKTGALGAAMLDYEGETVEASTVADDFELKTIGAHKGIILNMLKDISNRRNEALESVAIETARARLAIIPLKEGYYLLVALTRKTPVGKALFESRHAAELIKKEMG